MVHQYAPDAPAGDNPRLGIMHDLNAPLGKEGTHEFVALRHAFAFAIVQVKFNWVKISRKCLCHKHNLLRAEFLLFDGVFN